MHIQEKSNRVILTSDNYFKMVEDYSKDPFLDISWICSEKVVIILGEGHHVRGKVLASRCTKVLTIIGEKGNIHGSLDLDFMKSKHLIVSVIGVGGNIKIQNPSKVMTRDNGGLTSIRTFGREYFRVKGSVKK